MQERKVILTWEAVYDITDITDYIERDFGIRRADRLNREHLEQEGKRKPVMKKDKGRGED